MDFFSDHKTPKTDTEKQNIPSTTELFSSAKVVADAAKASLSNEADKLDKAKVADAAGDLLEAASHYGKLEENQGVGKYVQKAEDYLHNYKTSTTTTTTSHSTTTTHSAPMDSSSHSSSGGGDGQSESGGYGEYFKMAEGFLKKH
ncbi:hypothetical protein BVC80_9083g19 [Macleaya cordata]|uniref:Nodulin-related protein 1 n=1 Tax=Macleaya cordata TaxID=56857 RepID=A0A200PRA9_MACCD|nr:hypothetical protein BVC80_9083g19 [Macleaya cordata]